MSKPFARRLSCYATLTDRDVATIEQMSQNARRFRSHVDVVKEGEAGPEAFLVMDGFACRYKMTDEGRRQILSYMLPGDLYDRDHALTLMDHSIGTLSECTLASIPRMTLESLNGSRIAHALTCAAHVDSAILREWMLNIGQRSGEKRVAHLLCELLVRLNAVGLADKDSFVFPITQVDLADTVGLSTVHVNRILQDMKHEDLISWRGDTLKILNVGRLFELSGFNPNYLHVNNTAVPKLTGATSSP